ALSGGGRRRADPLGLRSGRPSPCDWGQTRAVTHVSGLGSREISGFTARYDFGLSVLSLAANPAPGLLIIASFSTFDGSGRSSYFTRDFFHREGDGLSS